MKTRDMTKEFALEWYLKGFKDAETTESQNVPLSQTLKDAETHFNLIWQEQDLPKSNVVNQRELLLAFARFMTNHITGATDKWREENVDLFLSQ